MFLLGGTEVYQGCVRLSWKFHWRYVLMSATYNKIFRLIEPFSAETQTFQNDSFSNFILKILFCRESISLIFFLTSAYQLQTNKND